MARYYVEYEHPTLGRKWCFFECCSGSDEQDKKDIGYTVNMYGGRVLLAEKLGSANTSGRV